MEVNFLAKEEKMPSLAARATAIVNQYHIPHSYTHSDVADIQRLYGSDLRSMQNYKGRIIFIFKENSHNNDFNEDGFICGLTNPNRELVPEGVKQQLIASIFLKDKNRNFIYMGDVNNIARYDEKRNIMLWG
jgi:hypothetical protein